MIGWIIWGSGGDSVNLGVSEHKHCQTCQQQRPFKTILQYRYAHLYWIFAWVTWKQYSLLCDICDRGWTLDTADVEKTLARHPIPFMRRWGWAFLVGFFMLIAFMASSRPK
jgi:hypothetical protein